MSTNFAEPTTSMTPDAVVDAAVSTNSSTAAAVDDSQEVAASDETQGDTTDDLSLSDAPEQTDETQEASSEGEEPEVLDDPLADFDTQPLTRAQIDQMFPRVATAARDLLEKAETARGKYLAERDALGGEQGIELFKTIAPYLSNPTLTPKDTDPIFEALVDANDALVASMGRNLIEHALNSEGTAIPMANDLLQGEFGDGYTLEVVSKIIGYHKAGLMNDEAFEDAHKLQAGQKSAAHVQAEEKAAMLEKKLAAIEEKVDSGATAQQQRLQQEAIDLVSKTVMERIPAHAAKAGWVIKETDPPEIKTAKRTLANIVTKHLSAQSMDWPERSRIDTLIKEGKAIGADGKPTQLFEANLQSIGPKGYAEFISITRDLSVLLRDASRLRTTPKKQITSEATTANGDKGQLPPPQINPPSGQSFNWDDPKYRVDQAAINAEWERVNGQIADARTQVGRR